MYYIGFFVYYKSKCVLYVLYRICNVLYVLYSNLIDNDLVHLEDRQDDLLKDDNVELSSVNEMSIGDLQTSDTQNNYHQLAASKITVAEVKRLCLRL